MANHKEKSLSVRDTSKTMSTLQMWQQQMAALQRVSQVGNDELSANETPKRADKVKKTRSRSTLVYPLLP